MYFLDNDVKLNGEPDDFSGVENRDDGELLRLLKEKMIYPAVTYTKEGWKLCHEESIVEVDDAIAIKVSGGMQTFKVIVNDDEEADEIAVSSEKCMSLQLQEASTKPQLTMSLIGNRLDQIVRCISKLTQRRGDDIDTRSEAWNQRFSSPSTNDVGK